MEVGMKKGMKIFLIVLAVVLLLIFSLYRFWAGNYNAMVQKVESVDVAWAQVQNQYQRRFDLIPNLVSTVQGYASHEREVFSNIAEARSRAGGVLQVSDKMFNTPESFARFQQAQNELGSALQRLLVITENYPELKADQNFLALQDQLEGTENRIGTERKRFNDVVRDYNTFIRQFPRVIIANMSGFTAKQYFAAGTEAQSAPQVQF
jgi:LemA protein